HRRLVDVLAYHVIEDRRVDLPCALDLAAVDRPDFGRRYACRRPQLGAYRLEQVALERLDVAPVDILARQPGEHVDADPLVGQRLARIGLVEIDQALAQRTAPVGDEIVPFRLPAADDDLL